MNDLSANLMPWLAGLVLPLLMLALQVLENPWPTPKKRQKWPAQRFAAFACTALAVVCCCAITHALVMQNRATRRQPHFEVWMMEANRGVDGIQDLWTQVRDTVVVAAPADEIEEMSNGQIQESANLLLDLLLQMENIKAIHRPFLLAVGSELPTGTLNENLDLQRQIRRMLDEENPLGLRQVTRSGWIALADMMGRAGRESVQPAREALVRERVRFNSDPAAWTPRVSPEELLRLMAPFLGRKENDLPTATEPSTASPK